MCAGRAVPAPATIPWVVGPLVLLLLLLGQAMLEGSAPGRQGQAAPAALWPALVAVLMVALALWWGLQQAPKPAILAW